MAAPTTLTLNLVTAAPSSKSGTSTKASSTPSECPKPTASKAAISAAAEPSTPPGTIAGGVIGSVAGLGLLLALLLYCCRRKRKITFKRKVVQKTDPDEASRELEAATQEKDDVVRQLEQARKDKPLPSPRSLDFGLPKIRHSTSPVLPNRWI
ncbi:hypothetical protein H2200_001447 [Cladophialophora chaetospira]|uniref:Uncharacterized protein n=1 Tax=Cladophialophora chaetospira TaxID=386627 RepID=A0AA38XKW1_9EURO|nr:hypothetical protein H2200_001447 [Cladophialophora chaetospira]